MSRKSRTQKKSSSVSATRENAAAQNPVWIIGICVALAAATWIVYGQTLRHEFINLDDVRYVLQNPHVANGLSVNGIVWAFTHVYAWNWHPLTWISHMLDCQFFHLDPAGHHFTSVLVHSLAAIVCFLTLRQMTGATWPSAFVAALFAIHPLHVESVAWVAERKDVLSGLFFLLTIAAYVRYARGPWSMSRYLLVLLSFAAGLMCKPMLVTVPFVLLLLDYWPLNRIPPNGSADWRRIAFEKLPFLILACASCTATLFAQSLQPLTNVPLTTRVANAAVSTVVYLRQFFWPSNLAAYYPFARGDTATPAILSLAVLSAITLAVFVLRRRYLVVGWFWYLIMLIPVIGLVQVGSQAHADRYTYLPQIGLCLMLAWGAADLGRASRQARVVLAGVAIASVWLLICVAHTQASYWRNSEVLWRHTIAVTGDNPMAHTNLGDALHSKGDANAAIGEYEAALALDPNYADAHAALGLAYLETGRPEESVEQLLTAVKIDPNFPEAHYNLGVTYSRLGRPDEALVQYTRASELKPDYVEALNNMAFTIAASTDPAIHDGPKSVALAQRASALTNGSNARINLTLAVAYAHDNRLPEALETAEKALRIATAQGDTKLADAIRTQIELFRNGSLTR